MQAIQTRTLAPTNFKGARITAWCEAKKITISREYALNDPDNHKLAAFDLRERMGWKGELIGGTLPNGDMCWVFMDDMSPRVGTVTELAGR